MLMSICKPHHQHEIWRGDDHKALIALPGDLNCKKRKQKVRSQSEAVKACSLRLEPCAHTKAQTGAPEAPLHFE